MSFDKISGMDQIIKLLDNFYEKTGLSASMYLIGDPKPVYSNRGEPKSCEEFCRNPDNYRLFDTSDNLHTCGKGIKCRLIPIDFEEACIGFFLIRCKRIQKNEEHSQEIEDILGKNVKQLLKVKTITIIELMIVRRQIRSEDELLSSDAKMRHIIYQPLQALIAMADNLRDEIEPTEPKDTATRILQELIKLSYAIGPLNDKNYAFKPQYWFSKVDVISILDEIVELFRNEAKSRGVEIRTPVVIPPLPSTYIEASEPHIRQIFYNILHNAIKYSYTCSKSVERYINIYCSAYKNNLHIEISNYGVGILENEIKKGLIFHEGYRGELTKDSTRTGSGLGLSITKKYLEDQGGKIEIKSECRGLCGKSEPYKTTVTINLPFTQDR